MDFHFVFHGLGPWHEAFAACGEACLSGTLVAVVAIGTLAALIIVIIGALLIAAGALTTLVVVVVGALLVPAGALAALVVVGALMVPARALATLVIVVVGALLVAAGALAAALVAVGALTVGTLLIARRFRGAFGRHVAVAVVVGALWPGLVGTRLIASLASIWPLLIAAGTLLVGALLAIRIFTGVFAVAVFVVIG